MPETQEEKNGELVDFPVEEIRMPPERLPRPVGRIASGHPLVRPLIIGFILLAIILGIQVIYSLVFPGGNEGRPTFSESFREEGRIIYEGDRIQGWFLDTERQHFMTEDGRRFTYVDSHEREGAQVTGHWRLIE